MLHRYSHVPFCPPRPPRRPPLPRSEAPLTTGSAGAPTTSLRFPDRWTGLSTTFVGSGRTSPSSSWSLPVINAVNSVSIVRLDQILAIARTQQVVGVLRRSISSSSPLRLSKYCKLLCTLRTPRLTLLTIALIFAEVTIALDPYCGPFRFVMLRQNFARNAYRNLVLLCQASAALESNCNRQQH